MFSLLGNVSSQLLYRVLSQVPSKIRKHLVFHFHLVTYEMDVSETITTGQFIDLPKIDKFFTFFPSFFSKSGGCQLATFVEILFTKYIFHSSLGPKWLQLEALQCSGRCLPTPVNVNSLKIKIRCCVRRLQCSIICVNKYMYVNSVDAAGREINFFFPDSHLAPKFFKVVAK